ncbi:MAG: hypothetical protein HYZ87_02420 [Candidatus Omnitrophica bacterium]|nr:hypothetical protein [Candidatus Omnitrophota bacterium]
MRSKKDFKAFFSFFASNRNLIILPVFVLLIVIGIVIIVAESSAVAPFIYTLF